MAERSFDKSAGARIHIIAIAIPRSNFTPVAVDVRSAILRSIGAGVAAGAIAGPAAAAAASADNSTGASVRRLSAESTYTAVLREAITEVLVRDGYTTTSADLREAKIGILPGSNQPDLDEVKAVPADAVLYIVINAGGYANSLFSTYRPDLNIDVELLDVHTGNTLFYTRYLYTTADVIGGTQFTPDSKYTFSSLEDVDRHPELSSEGLAASIPLIASDLGRRLQRQ
jgi:hypothetical protein